MGKDLPANILGGILFGALMTVGVTGTCIQARAATTPSSGQGAATVEDMKVTFSEEGEVFVMHKAAGEWFINIISDIELADNFLAIAVNDACQNERCIGSTNVNGCKNGYCFAVFDI